MEAGNAILRCDGPSDYQCFNNPAIPLFPGVVIVLGHGHRFVAGQVVDLLDGDTQIQEPRHEGMAQVVRSLADPGRRAGGVLGPQIPPHRKTPTPSWGRGISWALDSRLEDGSWTGDSAGGQACNVAWERVFGTVGPVCS